MDCVKLLLLAAVFLPGIVRAAENCPWLNGATAAGVLNVPVESSVTHHGNIAECVFRAAGTSPKTALRIEIETEVRSTHPLEILQAKCASIPVVLKTIGNEAIACSAKGAGALVSEAVFGRVRDQVFTIEIGTDDRRVSREVLRVEARKAAEHVAGNLF